MMLIKQGRIVPDPWVRLDGETPLPADGTPALIPFARWRAERDRLIRHNGPLGILLAGDQPPAAIAGDLDRFDLVALEFAKFTDGRAYSHASLLRRRWRFAGELRAVGQVLRDQLFFMVRCGFDAFEMTKEADAAAFAQALAAFDISYQPASDGRPSAAILRTAPRTHQSVTPAEARACAGMWAY